MKIVSTITIEEKELARFKTIKPDAEFEIVKSFSAPDDRVEVLLTYGWDVKEETLDLYPNLRWIQAMVAGVDALPLSKLAARRIVLTNVRGTHKIQMAEHTIWSLLTIMRQGLTLFKQQEQKVWNARVRIEEMHDKTVCIVGTGEIGQAIAEKCRAFGMKVLGVSRSGTPRSGFDGVVSADKTAEFFAVSDVVIAVIPLIAETRNFFNAERFAQMKDGVYFVNVARGPVVDEQALLHALQSGKIKAAALDVFVEEPLPADSPFWELENVLITPHIGGRSPYYSSRMWEVMAHNLKAYPDVDKMINRIDLQKGY